MPWVISSLTAATDIAKKIVYYSPRRKKHVFDTLKRETKMETQRHGKKSKSRSRNRSTRGNRWTMFSAADNDERAESDTAVIAQEEGTSETVLTNALKNNIGNSIGTTIANFIIEVTNHSYNEKQSKKKKNDLDQWFAELKKAHLEMANYLLRMSTGGGETGIMTISSLYTQDIRNIIKIVILKEKLFTRRTVISQGLLKFDSIVDTSKSIDRSEVLYAAIASEGKDNTSEALVQLSRFTDSVTKIFCPRINQILIKDLNLGPVKAALTFSEIVKFIEKFNNVNGVLPGIEFRNLLADINIKMLESDITLDRGEEENSGHSNKKSNDATKRNLIRALRTMNESKPLSDKMPMHQDTASDVLCMPNSAELANIPLPPVNLLIITNYINSLLSLEKMAVFTVGTFKSVCMIINQNFYAVGGVKNMEALTSKIVKKDVLATEEEDSSDTGGSESDASEKDEGASSKKNSLCYLNFLTDNSIILNNIREFIDTRQYKNMIDYINETASASENTRDYIISALTDALVNTLEERDTLKDSVMRQRSILPVTETSKLADKLDSVQRDIVDLESNKAECLAFMLSDVDRMAIYRHEIILFNRKLIASNSKNSTDHLINSFFNRLSMQDMETEDSTVILPKLNDFAVISTVQAVMLIEAFNKVSSARESEEKIKILRSLRMPGEIPDPLSDNHLSKLIDRYSSLTSKPRELFKSKLVAVVATEPGIRLLYPSASLDDDDNDDFTRAIRWQSLVNRLEILPEIRELRTNVASASSDKLLAQLLFGSSIKEERRSSKDKLALIIDNLFSLVDATSKLVFDKDENKAVLVLDDGFLDKVVEYLYKTYNTSASVVYSDVIQSFNEGETKWKNNEVGGNYPSVFARRLTTNISENFLKKNDTKAFVDPNKKKAEAGLVNEISNRAADIVKSQIANVIVTIVLINTACRIQRLDELRVESASANGDDIPAALINAVNYISNTQSRDVRKGLIKSVNHLSVYIGLSAAIDMLKLSNGYFFSVLRQSGLGKCEEEGQNQGSEKKQEEEKTPSWVYTALRGTLIGKPFDKVRATGVEKEHFKKHTNVMELLKEIT